MKTYTYSYQNGLCRGREVRPGTRQTWQASLTPRRIWPGTRPDGANARNGVGAYCIRPPNRAARPEWDVPGAPRVSPRSSTHQGFRPWL